MYIFFLQFCRSFDCLVAELPVVQVCSRSFNFINHSYDYRPNWTPLGPVGIINHHSCFITSVIILALGLDRPIKDLRIKEKKQIKNDLSGKDIEGRQKLLTLYLLRVTQREFLLTISIQYQA